MPKKTPSTRAMIAAVLYFPLNAVLFGAGAIALLSSPVPEDSLKYLFPAVIVAALLLTAPLAWYLAPKLRLRDKGYSKLFR